MYRVENYIEEIRKNLDNKTAELVKSFKGLDEVQFPETACVLVIDTSFSYNTGFYLAVNEDMFNEVDRVSGDSEYTDGLILVDNFILYSRDKNGFDDFFIENDLEKIQMKKVSQWIKKCFDLAKVTLPLPIYFRYPDEDDALNLVTGEWEDQMEIEL